MIKINYNIIPLHMQSSIKGYIENGIPTGDFLTAVLSNKLVESFGRADDINRMRMQDWAMFLYNEAPSNSWGSKEKIKKWIKIGGLHGIKARREEINENRLRVMEQA